MAAPEDTAQGLVFRQLINSIWRHKWLVVMFGFAGFVFAVIQLHRMPASYTVTMRVASVALEQSQSRGAGDRSLTGLAALAGVALPSSANGIGFELYQAGLTGRPAAEVLARQPGFLQTMFAGEWDATNKRWREPHSALKPLRTFVSKVLGTRVVRWEPPDAARVQEVLSALITVQKSNTTPIVTISVRIGNPDWGRKLLSDLHSAVDGALRDKTLARANRYIGYLNQELAGTTISDVRASLVATLIDQEKQRMLASSGLDFAADPLEAPVASRMPTSPNASQVMLLYTAVGVIAGILAAFLLGRFQLTLRDLVVLGRRRLTRQRPQAQPAGQWQATPEG